MREKYKGVCVASVHHRSGKMSGEIAADSFISRCGHLADIDYATPQGSFYYGNGVSELRPKNIHDFVLEFLFNSGSTILASTLRAALRSE